LHFDLRRLLGSAQETSAAPLKADIFPASDFGGEVPEEDLIIRLQTTRESLIISALSV
jgi:hypothetical protein